VLSDHQLKIIYGFTPAMARDLCRRAKWITGGARERGSTRWFLFDFGEGRPIVFRQM